MQRVITTGGSVAGTDLGSIRRFAGIRYAHAPTGDRRFRPPEPVRASGDIDATRFAPTAWQPASALETMLGGGTEERSEDCLALNVWTPGPDARRRPVMVWIHGGGFTTGSGSSPIYDGAVLAERGDVVVVTLNYRLGALGFLSLEHLDPTYAGSANTGILDQLAALEWVNDNIAAFGGDPSNVTIFGESAGAMSVGTLLAIAGDGRLFQRAILQSGAAHNASTLDGARSVTDAVMAAAGAESIDDLLRIEPASLIAAGDDVRNGGPMVLDRIDNARQVGPSLMAFQPVVDGSVVVESPIDLIAGGAGARVSVLAGVNADEWNLFDPTRKPVAAGRIDARLERLGGSSDAAGRLASAYGVEVDPDGNVARSVQSAVMTDVVFRLPAVRLLEARDAGGAPGYHYHFGWGSPVAGGILGSCHALELPFVFGTLGIEGMRSFVGDAPPVALSERMQDAWLHFARHGVPGNDWEPYDRRTRPVHAFDGTDARQHDPYPERTHVWRDLL